ncbi:MAG: PAS domain S-box protein [Thermodesulfobacteriota bacterium]|nr:PAS domain S-box protein [Thermodesulfobacteriota bacterium]
MTHPGIGRNTKALRENEKKFRSICAAAQDAIIMMDNEGNISYWNEAAEQIFGYSSQEALGQEVHILLAPMRYHEAYRGGFSRFKATGQVPAVGKTLELAAVKKDGTEFPIELSVSGVNLEGKWSAIGILRDITGRKQAEERLLKVKTELEEMNRRLQENQAQLVQSEKMASIGQLAAGVAHEINNPVGFINSNLTTLDEYRRDLTTLINNYLELEQLADRDPALSNNHDLVSTLETIRNLKEKMDIDFVLGDFDKVIAESREGTDRIKKIVQALKDFSHVDQAELKWANLNKGLESTLNIVWNEIKYKATVKKDYGDIPEVYCYPQQINQVFMNILVNAAHAIEDKGEIGISDTGKGIPPANLRKIFDPFFTTKPVGKGTGLGLNVSYNIVKKHQGEIKVESEVGKGTTFVIRLPVEGPKEGEEKTQ